LLWQQNIKADDCVGKPQDCHEISVMSRFWVAPRGRLLGCISVRTAPCERLARNRRDGRETIKAARMAEMISGDLRRSHLHVRKPAAALTLREASRVSSDRWSALSRYKTVTPTARPNDALAIAKSLVPHARPAKRNLRILFLQHVKDARPV
jgi:hypothetical protein